MVGRVEAVNVVNEGYACGMDDVEEGEHVEREHELEIRPFV